MKNVLIALGVGCAGYGMYLWIHGMRTKGHAAGDCGCGCGGSATAVAPPSVNQDMMPDSMRVAYDASFNKAFIGRGESGPIGAGLTEDVNAFAPMKVAE